MIGGDEEVVEPIRPVLDTFCSLVVRMGPLGAGLQAKLARNLVQYASWLAAYEAQVLAEAAGIELAKLAQVIKASDDRIGGASTLMFRKTVAPFPPDTDPGFVGAMPPPPDWPTRTSRAAIELASDLGVDLPLAALTDASRGAIFGIAREGGESNERVHRRRTPSSRSGVAETLGAVEPPSRRSTRPPRRCWGRAPMDPPKILTGPSPPPGSPLTLTDWSTDLALCGFGASANCRRPWCLTQKNSGDLTIAEVGSPHSMTLSAQLDDPVASLGWVADLAEGYEWETDLGVAGLWGCPPRRFVRREATGVVGAITPWNVPHQINLAKLGPALAAGNTVVLKPAPDTPWCAIGARTADRRGDGYSAPGW